MTTCPACGRPVPAGVGACPGCGAELPVLPEGLFRDSVESPVTDVDATASFTPDFLQRTEAAPELSEDLFRTDPPGATAATPLSATPLSATPLSATPLSTTPLSTTPTTRGTVPYAPASGFVARPYQPAPLVAPAMPGTPESDLLPSERPTASEPTRSRGGMVILAILALLVGAAVVGGWIWWGSPQPRSGGVPSAIRTTTVGPVASAPTEAAPASSGPSAATSGSRSTAPAAPFPPGAAKACSDNVAVRDATSCEFAANVAAALPPDFAVGTTRTVTASSPVTGQTYQMTCAKETYVTCTGGINATVYVRVLS